jgi:hypothetical protein
LALLTRLEDEQWNEGSLALSILPFDNSVAYRLMKIADDERIAAHAQQLPPSWETLALLTRRSRATSELVRMRTKRTLQHAGVLPPSWETWRC